MFCPLAGYKSFAYLYKYYPKEFDFMINKMRETEIIREKELGKPFSVISSNPKYNSIYLKKIVIEKYVNLLDNQK